MKMRRKFSDDKLWYIICFLGVVFLALSLIPVLSLSFYNYPCADDFSAADTAYRAWRESGSLGKVLEAAWNNVIYNYKEWSGVFASVFWTSLQPGIFGEGFYALTAWITMGLLLLSVFYFFRVIFHKFLKVKFSYWLPVAVIFLYLMLQCMPSGVEGLYWHPGAANYTWAHAFLLFMSSLCLSSYVEKNKEKRIIKLFFSCIMAVFVGGGNYITSLQAVLWMGCMIIFFFYNTHRKNSGFIKETMVVFMIPAGVLAASFLVSILAPGNQVRMAVSEGMSPVSALLYSYVYAVKIPLTEWFVLPMIPGFGISLLFMIKIVEKRRITLPANRGFLLMTAFLMVSAVAAGFTPNLYAQGRMEAGRLHNAVYFIWLMVIYILLFVLAVYFVNFKKRYLPWTDDIYNKAYYLFVLAAALCLTLLWFIMPGICIGSRAMESLMSGQAQAYKIQQEERLAILLDPQVKHARLPFLKNPPELLLFQDITSDSNEWVNSAMAEYYGKELVTGVEGKLY